MDDIKGVFPITEKEAAMLHDLGWSSGYGWATEWDWWRTAFAEDNNDINVVMESREWEETRKHLVANLVFIRVVEEEAMALVRRLLNADLVGGAVEVSGEPQPMGIQRLDGGFVGEE